MRIELNHTLILNSINIKSLVGSKNNMSELYTVSPDDSNDDKTADRKQL